MSHLGVFVLVSSLVAQQPDTVRLDPITVTATRVPVAANTLSSSLTVLQGEDLRLRGIGSVAEALRDVPGITVLQTGSFGGSTSIFLRGGESDYVQVLIDGVPVNQPGGAFDFAHLSTTNVERIEVLRGPGSVLYGSDATTGVIQIVTREGRSSPTYSLGLRGGTYGTVNVDADVSGGSGNVRYSFGASHFLSDGSYPFNNDYDNTVWSGRVHVDADEKTDIALSIRYRDSEYHYPTDGSGNLVDENSLTSDGGTTLGIDAGRWLTNTIELRALISSHEATLGREDAQDGPADTTGSYASRSLQELRRRSADVRANFHLNPLVITTGAQIEEQDERSFNESMSDFGPSNGSTAEDRNTKAAYGQILGNFSGLSVTVGGRVDDNSAFGTFWTYRGGLSYSLPSGTILRGSVGRSFKAPSFFENFATGFVTGNPDLRPERSTTWEAAVSHSTSNGMVVMSGTFFHQSFRDLIQFTFDETPNYMNVAMADASGIEVEVGVEPVPGLDVSGSYTYLDTDVVDAGLDSGEGATFVQGNRLLRRPTHTVNASAEFRWTGSLVGVGVRYLGNRDDRDFSDFPAAPVVLPSVTTADVWGSLTLLPQRGARPAILGTVRIENALNKVYQTVIGFPARGRTVLVGARLAGGGF